MKKNERLATIEELENVRQLFLKKVKEKSDQDMALYEVEIISPQGLLLEDTMASSLHGGNITNAVVCVPKTPVLTSVGIRRLLLFYNGTFVIEKKYLDNDNRFSFKNRIMFEEIGDKERIIRDFGITNLQLIKVREDINKI